ncbi:MAG TPA: DNA/RNA non-specific endonuclease [Gemmatimonadaceae bacterium]|jgi:DNA/RNA endonuclease G (NUC1)
MRFPAARPALLLLFGASILSCKDSPTAVRSAITPQGFNADVTVRTPTIVISQIYGGGGNSGATLKNDFIELFNPGSQNVSLAGWSVQYASAAGSFTQTTALSGSITPGSYYLVQEAAGTGGTVSLPTPNATGSIAMAAGSGKVLVAQTTTAIGACPDTSNHSVVDLVSYGTGTNCRPFTATLSNTTAAFRKDPVANTPPTGCAYTGDPSADFSTGAPAPRNSASPVHVCAGALPLGPLDHVVVAGPTNLTAGSSAQLAATAQDANNQTVTTATITWTTSDVSVATVDATGKVTAVAASATPVTITATATDDNITAKGTLTIAITTPTINWIDVSSSSTSFPPGFQTQLFATARTADGGTVIPATFTFEAVDPTMATIATVENTGIIAGVAPPSDGTSRPGFKVTATPVGGGPTYSFVSHPVAIETPAAAPASIYAVNDEFGDPTPATSSNPNDLLIRRTQYTLSYNESHGTPNWVSYELDSRQMVAGQDRCNCFTADPTLPADKQILTADYTNGGYDRGHMTRSADRTAGNVDNASTFYLTNVVPQQADLNQGVWAQFENALADSANRSGRAVYIITGPLYSQSHALTFLKNEGKVAIPDSTWKIALIGPRNAGNPFARANVQGWSDLAGITILAVNMPNVAGVRNDPWSKYLTTVAKIEQGTGYNFFSLLQSVYRDALEVGDRAPIAQYAVTGNAREGSPVTFDASSSSDADLSQSGISNALTYSWQFSDGATATGRTTSHTFAHFGPYAATLTVTDAIGWPSTVSQTLMVDDVAPVVTAPAGASLIAGETYSASAGFADPGTDSWTGTVDYGDGSGPQPLTLAGKSFTLSHVYGSAGTFRVTVTVSDDGGAGGSSSSTVSVMTPFAATKEMSTQVQLLAESGAIAQPQPLFASIDAAAKQIQRGDMTPAFNELGALINKIGAAVISGRMSPEAAQQLTDMIHRIQNVLRT